MLCNRRTSRYRYGESRRDIVGGHEQAFSVRLRTIAPHPNPDGEKGSEAPQVSALGVRPRVPRWVLVPGCGDLPVGGPLQRLAGGGEATAISRCGPRPDENDVLLTFDVRQIEPTQARRGRRKARSSNGRKPGRP